MELKNFKEKDRVVMHTCHESTKPQYKGKIWTCEMDSYVSKSGEEVVFLEGFSGCFMAKYLEIVKIKESDSVVKKKNFELNAEIKTLADYALILEHCNGYSLSESRNLAKESHGEPLFEKLLQRNIELFKTGDVVMFG